MSAPVTKWPGSKWRIADVIVANMPRHDCYTEPFFGSGAPFFSKEPSNVEIINDLDSLVVNLFRVIRDDADRLTAAIALTPWARDEYDLCSKDLLADDDVERARRLLVSMWQGLGVRRTSGQRESVGGKTGWRVRDTLYQSPVATWQKLPERIRVASQRLLGAQIENRPALEVIVGHASPEVLIYADPPYVLSSRGASEGEGGRLYAHEMSDKDHLELLGALKAHPGPVLLSAYQCALYEENLPWHRLEFRVRIQNNQTRMETLYLNPVAVHRLERERAQHRLFEMPLQRALA